MAAKVIIKRSPLPQIDSIKQLIRSEERNRDKIIGEYLIKLLPKARYEAKNDMDFAGTVLSNTMIRFARAYGDHLVGKQLHAESPEVKGLMYRNFNWALLDEIRKRNEDEFLIHVINNKEDFFDYCCDLEDTTPFTNLEKPKPFFDFIDELLKENLTEFQRDVFEGIISLQQSHREVAERLNSNVNSTKSSLSQAKKILLNLAANMKGSTHNESPTKTDKHEKL